MKNHTFSILLGFFALFVFVGCEPEENETISDGGDQPWERQFLYGNTVINGEDVLTHEVSTTADYIEDYVCYNDIPSGSLQTFSVNVYVPTHSDPNFQSGLTTRGMHIFYNGTQTPDIIFDVIFIRKEMLNNLEYSKFLVGGQYDGSDIDKNNFQQFRLDFDMVYLNENGEEIHSDAKAVSIDIQGCGSGSGDGSGDLTFYLLSDLGCGYIDVTLTGVGSETITGYFGSAPNCGESGAANFYDLDYGTYDYHGECSSLTWDGTVTIDGGCTTIEFTD